MTDISNYNFIEDLRDYAADKRGELGFYLTEAADRIEQAEWDIERLRDQIDGPKWITDRDPTPEEVEQAGDTGFILCISGQVDNVGYIHAIDMCDNYFEDGKWYLHGAHPDKTCGLQGDEHEVYKVHGWMMPPSWED